MTLDDKINTRMDQLQQLLESNHHLVHPEECVELIQSVTKFWRRLSDEDKDYIHAAQWAIEEQNSWK